MGQRIQWAAGALTSLGLVPQFWQNALDPLIFSTTKGPVSFFDLRRESENVTNMLLLLAFGNVLLLHNLSTIEMARAEKKKDFGTWFGKELASL